MTQQYRAFTMLALCAWVLTPVCSHSQSVLDSLELSLVASNADTGRVNTLIEIGYTLSDQGKHEEAEKRVNEALELARKVNYRSGMSRAYSVLSYIFFTTNDHAAALQALQDAFQIEEATGNLRSAAISLRDMGNIYSAMGNQDESKRSYERAIEIFGKIGDKNESALINLSLGGVYMDQGLFIEALPYYRVALSLFEDLKDKLEISHSINNIGLVYYRLGQYTEALTYLLQALEIREEIQDHHMIAESYNDIAGIYKEQGKFKDAEEYYKHSLAQFEITGNHQRISLAHNNLGGLYFRIADLDQAIWHFNRSIQIKEENSDKPGLAIAYVNMSAVFIYQKKYEEALEMLIKAQTISKEIGNLQVLSVSYLNMGRLNIELGRAEEARSHLNNALEIFKQTGEMGPFQFVYKHLSRADSLAGDFESALANFKLHKYYTDSLLNERNSEIITEMQTKYETEKKSREISALQSEKEISGLKLQAQAKTLTALRADKERSRIENLYQQQQLDLQQLELGKKNSDLIAQQALASQKADQVIILEQEGVLQMIQLSRQKQINTYALVGIGLIFLLAFIGYRYYVTRQSLKLQTLRNKIASDLHDEVGSTLSSISIFSEMAQKQSKEVIPSLQTIGESSRKMLDAMADIVWTINPENDQFEKILLRMRNFAYELLGAKKIDFEFKSNGDISKLKLPMEVRRNLYLIFKEATNNMVKYAEATKASYSINTEKDHLVLNIRDNGKGFDVNLVTEGNGLRNMRKRAEEVGGIISIISFPGNGTTIQLKIAV